MSIANSRSVPQDVLGVLEGEPEEILLLQGEAERSLRAGKVPVARSRCEIRFESEPQLLACVEAIRQSGERMAAIPVEETLYNWERTYRRGMSLVFGVVWFDREFFARRRDAYRSGMHLSLFDRFGVSEDAVRVEHEEL